MKRVDAPSEIAGRYVIAGRIGSGGMGDVFRARDSVLGRTVAIKMLPFELAVQPGFVERFRAEAQAVAKISHTGVVQVHDWGQEGDSYYMVMEYVRGKNLRQILASNQRLSPKQAAQVTGQVLGALGAAHEKGVVHRDVKPENVLVSTEGRVKVADFGIARAVENASLTGGMMGTVAYVAPEQARGERVDARTDLYSTGCMLYELLTGSLPFEGDAAKVLQDHLNSRVPAPSALVPEAEALDRVVRRATSPQASERYQSAAEMRKDLASVMDSLAAAPPLSELTGEFTSEASSESLETVVHHAPPPKRRRRGRKILTAVLILLAVAAGGILYVGPTQVPSLNGVSRELAEERLAQAGLKAEVTEVHSDQIPPDEVVGSSPGAGSWLLNGGSVAVAVSLGPKLSDIPQVVGMQLEEAQQAILDNDLTFKVDRRHSIDPVDRIIAQDPPPKQVKSGDLVTLVASDGPAILPIPTLTGKGADAAEAELRELGFAPTREPVFNSAAAGTVVGQLPPADEPHPQGTEVKLQVSQGPQPFKVPDVKGKTCAAAKAQLEGIGMKVVTQTSAGGSAACGENSVLEQDPLPDSERRPGAEATLYVSG